MEEWYDVITLDRVAADAGVTVQTVIRRFGGKEGLLATAVQILAAQIDADREGTPDDLIRVVDRLVRDYELRGDAVIRLLALEPRHAALQAFLAYGRGKHREWVERSFAPQLSALTGPERAAAVDALVVVTDVYSWKLLRRDMARSAAATAASLRQMLTAILDNFIATPGRGGTP